MLIGLCKYSLEKFFWVVETVGWSVCGVRAVLCCAVFSLSVVSDSLWHRLQPSRLLSLWDSPGKNTGVGCLALLQGIFPTQGLNPSLPHCRWILYHLSHQGSPRILEQVSYPFSRGIFLTQESNWGLLHCRWILYQLSYQGEPPWELTHIYYQVLSEYREFSLWRLSSMDTDLWELSWHWKYIEHKFNCHLFHCSPLAMG